LLTLSGNDRERIRDAVMNQVREQFKSDQAQDELRNLGPANFDWNSRTRNTMETLVPRLVEIAPTLAEECVKPFNVNADIAEKIRDPHWRKGLDFLMDSHPALARQLRSQLDDLEDQTTLLAGNVEYIKGPQLSGEIERFLVSHDGLGDFLLFNGNSIHPDLIFKSYDYSELPFQSRDNPIEGPSLRNKKNPRPSNVPDGCEIKTNEGTRVRVDAHGPHPGLHLAVTWDVKKGKVIVNDILMAYIRKADYTESGRSVQSTTVKYSFGHSPFISILHDS